MVATVAEPAAEGKQLMKDKPKTVFPPIAPPVDVCIDGIKFGVVTHGGVEIDHDIQPTKMPDNIPDLRARPPIMKTTIRFYMYGPTVKQAEAIENWLSEHLNGRPVR
jgi:hypothetical protein